jgi:hypothetical protein
MEWVDDEHLAVDHAIPVRNGLLPELELVPNHWSEIIFQEPLCEQRAFGERSPQLFWRVRE